jgi:hypothetical protein
LRLVHQLVEFGDSLRCARGERLDVLLGAIVQIGDREISPERAKGPCATPSDRLVIRDADDEAFLPFKATLVSGIRES